MCESEDNQFVSNKTIAGIVSSEMENDCRRFVSATAGVSILRKTRLAAYCGSMTVFYNLRPEIARANSGTPAGA